jgi:hypothetical protein
MSVTNGMMTKEIDAKIEALKARVQSLEANPPAGAQAIVGEFTGEAWRLILNAALGPELIERLCLDTREIAADHKTLNARLQHGVVARLKSPATGGRQPTVIKIEELLEIITEAIARGQGRPEAMREIIMGLGFGSHVRVTPARPPGGSQVETILTLLRERPPLLFALMAELGNEHIAGPWHADTILPGTWYRTNPKSNVIVEVKTLDDGLYGWHGVNVGDANDWAEVEELDRPSIDDAKARADSYLIEHGWTLL